MNYSSAETDALYRFMLMARESLWMEHFNCMMPMLAEDCLLESPWLSVHKEGKMAVKAWLDDALEDRWVKNIVWHYGVAEIRNAPESSVHEGPFCLHSLRETDGEYNSILITAALDTQRRVNRIWISDGRPWSLRRFTRCIRFQDFSEIREDPANAFLLPDPYWHYLRIGMACADRPVYPRILLRKDELLEGLDYWQRFCLAESFDTAFEEAAGADYAAGRCERPETAQLLGRLGKDMWENRGFALSMADRLKRWTESFDDRFAMLKLREYPTRRDLSSGRLFRDE